MTAIVSSAPVVKAIGQSGLPAGEVRRREDDLTGVQAGGKIESRFLEAATQPILVLMAFHAKFAE